MCVAESTDFRAHLDLRGQERRARSTSTIIYIVDILRLSRSGYLAASLTTPITLNQLSTHSQPL